ETVTRSRDGDAVPVRVNGSAEVRGDEEAIARAVLNLVDNAARHADERVDVEVSSDGDRAVVAVRDDGPGFPPELLGPAATGLVDVLSALTPLMRDRLEVVGEAFTPEVAHLARGATALLGVALILLSRGIVRHRRLAYRTALVLLAVSAFTHVLKGLDVEE